MYATVKSVRLFAAALCAAAVLLTGCTPQASLPENISPSQRTNQSRDLSAQEPVPLQSQQPFSRVDFSSFNQVYRFSAELPADWKIEYIPGISSLNLYDPSDPAPSVREKSQIFIRMFESSSFLTLSTVDILNREETSISSHSAVRYEIEKKASVADFLQQPSWRNGRHQLIDIRLSEKGRTTFYVFSYNPDLSADVFEKFIGSLIFHNDSVSFVSPLDRSVERFSKKPFGIQVSPDNSPVTPERFSGYHTAVDLEVFPDEIDKLIEVRTFCGGSLLQKKVAAGYGGVAVQECLIGDQPVTVVYGHLNIDSIKGRVGAYLVPGADLGLLGAHQSSETDGERKHLHFGIHRGSTLDIRGYVAEESQLSAWMNPMEYLRN